MAYPGYPPGPPGGGGGGYPPAATGYPPQPGGPSGGMPAPYPGAAPPAGQPGPWVPGGAPPPSSGYGIPPPGAAPYPGQPPMPSSGGIGFGAGHPPPTGPSTYPPGPPGSSYPPGPTGSYPPAPSGSYPPGPPGSYPPAPSGSYPPAPSGSYPPGPPGSYPPAPSGSYPPAPSGSYPPGPGPSGTYSSAPSTQQAPGGYYNAPPPVPSSHTHQAAIKKPDPSPRGVAQATHGVASMSVTDKTQHHKEPATEGTVKAHANFNAETDARALRDAMKGFGTDEKAIISVVAYRSNAQRQQIKEKFKSMYGKDLIKELKGELSGHFEDVVLALLMTPREHDAFVVRNAIEGAGTDEDALIEILCSRDSHEITEIKQLYKKMYSRNLEKDVINDTSGHFKRLMISMLTGAREPSGPVDRQRARADAQALYRAGEARWGTDESMFNQILAAKSFTHLKAVFEEYSKVCKYDIEESISREMSGDLKDGMLTIVKCVRSKPAYFAEKLYKSMKGLGTNDRVLVRVMVSRCEVDMVQIKKVFYQKYHKTLGSFIKGDTSGDYRRILMALAREE